MAHCILATLYHLNSRLEEHTSYHASSALLAVVSYCQFNGALNTPLPTRLVLPPLSFFNSRAAISGSTGHVAAWLASLTRLKASVHFNSQSFAHHRWLSYGLQFCGGNLASVIKILWMNWDGGNHEMFSKWGSCCRLNSYIYL